jgi:hypothetical protein
MRRLRWVLAGLSMAAAVAAIVVVGTAPNRNPTPSDSLWGHQMPSTQMWIDLALIAASAALAALAASHGFRRFRLPAELAIAVTSAAGLYLLSVVAWRLHSPASAGNGG